jgi:uncharacterized protein
MNTRFRRTLAAGFLDTVSKPAHLLRAAVVTFAALFFVTAGNAHAQKQAEPQTAPALTAAELKCPAPPMQPSNEQVSELIRSAQDRGFLWKIEKAGRTSYLYGSIHVNKLETSFPGQQTIAALTASDVVALELDISDPEVQKSVMDPSRFGIRTMQLSDSTKRRMESAASSVCLPIAALGAMHPVMQMMTIMVFDARFIGLEATYGSEAFLAGFARGAKKDVVGLETAEIQLKALLSGDEKGLAQQIDKGLNEFPERKHRKVMQRMFAAWSSGNLPELENYERWCDCATTPAERDFFRRLNDNRNPGLAKGIDKLHMEGKRVFAAVGALHMTGAKSVPKLMAEMGYKVERVPFGR